MTRRGGGGKGEEAAGKVMGPLFPRLHVSDAGRGGGPRAPPRNKMALYEQFTVPSSRFSPPASASAGGGGGGGGGLAPSTSASQVYGYERPMFQPFNMSSIVHAHSSKKINGNSMNRQISSTRNESGRLSSQTNNNGVYAAGSAVECTSQHKGTNVTKNSSGKKLANDDQFMVPSINSPRCPLHSTQEHAEVQKKLKTLRATSSQRNPPATSKSSAKCYNAVNKHLERINVSDIRSVSSPKAKEKEPAQALKTVEAVEMSSIQVSKERFGSKAAKVCLMRDKASNINNSSKPHLGSTGCQAASMNGSSTKTRNPTSKDTVSCNPCTDLDITNRNSYLPEQSLKEAGTKRKRSLGHHDAKQNDDLSDSVESVPGWEISPDQIVGAIGQKHFWKARRAIQNQQRIFAVQVFELHKLIRVQKSIAACPHVLIEGDPCLGNVLVGKNKLPDENLKAQTLSITNKDAIHPSTDQPDLSKENTEGNPPSPCHDDGLDGNHHGQVTTNQAFTSNPTATPAASGNKQNNWCVNPPQNQWLVPVMSPSEGLVYKPYTGPCPPAGSSLTPFYANFTPLSLPSTAYGVPMPHQQQYMAPPGVPAMPMNYFPPFTLPVMNPAAPASAVEQGSHAAASQHNGNVQSRISCNMSNPSGIWKFYASRDSEPQASSASSPSDRLQGDGSGPVSIFPAASVQHAQAQPSSRSRDKQSHVIRVVPHNSQTASASAAWIFRSIQMERQQNDL